MGMSCTTVEQEGPIMILVPHQEFVLRAAEAPDAVAVADAEMTYATLDELSDSVATVLLTEGYGAGSVVALGVPRGVALIIGILGIAKAGAAFLAAAPERSELWTAELADEVGADFALTEDLVWEFARFGDRIPAARVDPFDPACVVPTPDLAGRPDGRVIRHRTVAERIRQVVQAREAGVGFLARGGACLELDAVVGEVLAPLVSGGCVRVGGDACLGPVSSRRLRLGFAVGFTGA